MTNRGSKPITLPFHLFLSLLFTLAWVLPAQAQSSYTQWSRFSNAMYGVAFDYPSHWTAKGPNDLRYEGSDGFFEVSAAYHPFTIEDVVHSEVTHHSYAFGTRPNVESFAIGGFPARLIHPSSDQKGDYNGQGALIVQYPRTIQVYGNPYNYFVLYASDFYLSQMANTLRFSGANAPKPTPPAPPHSGTVIVDDSDPVTRFGRFGDPSTWHFQVGGYGNSATWTYNNDQTQPGYNWARWCPRLRPGWYEVYVYLPSGLATTNRAYYTISHGGGQTVQVIDQANNGGGWVSLGSYFFQGNQNDWVSLTDVTDEPYLSRTVVWDAMKWVAR